MPTAGQLGQMIRERMSNFNIIETQLDKPTESLHTLCNQHMLQKLVKMLV